MRGGAASFRFPFHGIAGAPLVILNSNNINNINNSMNMKIRTLSVSVAMMAASMAIVSCSKDETPAAYDGSVRFTSGITAAPDTRVAIDDDTKGTSVWEKDDPVGIFMVKNGGTEVAEGAANIPYKAATPGATTTFTPADTPICYPVNDDAKVDFIAYHPYNAAVSGSDFTYPVNLLNQDSQTAIDLMYAMNNNGGVGFDKNDGINKTAVNFAFTHKLAKLVLKVTTDATVPGDITAVTIKGMHTTATFDLKTGALGAATGNATDITPVTITANSRYEAILLPVAYDDTHSVVFTVNGKNYVWDMKTGTIPNLAAGRIHTYDVNVTQHAVTVTGSIEPWNVVSGSGTAD